MICLFHINAYSAASLCVIKGAEWWVMQLFPWHLYTFLAITVERPKPELVTAFKDHGYIYLCDHGDWGDQFWVHESIPDLDWIRTNYQRGVDSSGYPASECISDLVAVSHGL